jgi:hypothetical protein
MNTATQQGAASSQPANPDLDDNEVAAKRNPRDELLEQLGQQQEEMRSQELQNALEADPGMAANHAGIEGEMQDRNEAAIAAGRLPVPEENMDGAASVEPMHEPEPEPESEPLPDHLQNDPLAEYITMEQGQPMFQAKVNGQQQLIPLDQAKRQLQIGTAAEIRMQEAAALQAQVEERERQVAASEAALAERKEAALATPPVPAQPDLTEEELLAEAKEIFETAFTGTEEEAAQKLTKVLVKLKTPAAPVVQPIDEDTIVRKAAGAAVHVIEGRDKQKDVQKGYEQFKTDYPDIMKDPKLYKMADDMTDEIEKEHPEWNISQVMLEAGKRTRTWVNNLTNGEDTDDLRDTDDPNPQPEDEVTYEQPLNPPIDRQARKQGLVRIPAVAAGAVHKTPSEDEGKPQTAHDAFVELKAARGQPV